MAGLGSALGQLAGRAASKPPPRRPPPRPRPAPKAPQRAAPRPTGVFAQPIARQVPQRQIQRAANIAGRRVQAAYVKQPGRARPPQFPQLKHTTPAQQRQIVARTGQYVQRVAQQQGFNPRGRGLAALANTLRRTGEPQARQAINQAQRAQQQLQTRQDAAALRAQAIEGQREILEQPVAAWAARDAARRALGKQTGHPRPAEAMPKPLTPKQALAGPDFTRYAAFARQAVAPTGPAAQEWRLEQPDQINAGRVRAPKPPGPLEKAAGFVLSPQHNAFAAVTSGLSKHSALFRDAFNLPANAVTSSYELGAATRRALQGHPEELKALGHSFVTQDPIALAAQGEWRKALKQAGQHPVSTALEVSGALGGAARLGELTAAGGRSVAAGELRGLSRGVEASVPGTDIAGVRRFSEHPLARVVQRARTPGRIAKSDRLRAQSMGEHASGNPLKARDLARKAAETDPRVFGRKEVRTRVDEHVATTEDVRRAQRQMAAAQAHKIGGKHGPLVGLVAQNIVRADRADIQAYLHDLAVQAPHLTGDQLRANHELQAQIETALSDRKLNFADIQRRANEFRDMMAPHEQALVETGMLDPAAAERAKLIPYAVRRMGAVHEEGVGLSVPTGTGTRLVTNDEIRAHMDANGAGEPAFLPQRPGGRTAGAFFRSFANRQTHRLGFEHRTGEAVRNGTFDAHPDVLVEHAANVQGLVSADRGFREFVRQFGLRGQDGEPIHNTYGHVNQIARDMRANTGRDVRPVRLNPFLGRKQQFQALVEHAGHTPEAAALAPEEAVASALRGEQGPGQWGLVDGAAADRLLAHQKILGPGGGMRAAQVVNQAFRRTVLPFSTKWVTGNMVEAGLRSFLLRAGPTSYMLGRRMFTALDRQIDGEVAAGRMTAAEAEAQKIQARAGTVGGGHFELQTRSRIHRSAGQWNEGEPFRNVARAVGTVMRAPGPKQIAGFVRSYTDWMTHTVNGTLERQFQTAMAGKLAKTQLFDHRIIGVSERAAEEAARGLRNTNTQVQLGRMVDEAYGRYSKFSPHVRQLIASATPFIAWTLNSIRFVTHTLPVGHPVVTGLLAAAQHATEDWQRAHGLSIGEPGQVPAFLEGSIPLGQGRFIRASRYTPFGLFQDPTGNIASLVIPQYTGLLAALQGKDWKGAPLHPGQQNVPPWQSIADALQVFAESTIPVYAQVQQTAQHKGPLGVKLQRQFNPFYPVQSTAQATAGQGPSGGPQGQSWTLPQAPAAPAAPSGGTPGAAPGGQVWTLPPPRK